MKHKMINTKSPQNGVHPIDSFPAWRALAAGLVLVERHQPVQRENRFSQFNQQLNYNLNKFKQIQGRNSRQNELKLLFKM